MHKHLSSVLTAGLLFCGAASGIATNAKVLAQEKRFSFPYFLPDSRIVIGQELVDEVNASPPRKSRLNF